MSLRPGLSLCLLPHPPPSPESRHPSHTRTCPPSRVSLSAPWSATAPARPAARASKRPASATTPSRGSRARCGRHRTRRGELQPRRRSPQSAGRRRGACVWGEEGGLNARAARGVWVGDCVCARWDKRGSETATSSASATLRSSSGAAAGGGTGTGRRRERAKRCAPLADNPQKGARAGGLSAVSTAPPWAAASLTQVTPTLARVDEEREKWRERRVTHLGRTRRAR